MAKNIIYLRVSKRDESQQDPEQQLKAIINHFNIKKYDLYQERGSAWDVKKVHHRHEFVKILRLIFDSDKTTIDDIYLGKFKKKEINIYVWDYARIIRNIELNLLFSLLCSWFTVKIYSFKDNSILKESEKETPTGKLTRIMMNTISAFSAEEYSYTISENTKKAYAGKGLSTYGKVWGKGFKGTTDNPRITEAGFVQLTADEKKDLANYIRKKLKTHSRTKVIEIVKDKKKLIISHSYLSRNFPK